MKDYLGQKLSKGDFVIFGDPHVGALRHGTITKIKRRTATVLWIEAYETIREECSEEFMDTEIVKIDGPAITAFLLREEDI